MSVAFLVYGLSFLALLVFSVLLVYHLLSYQLHRVLHLPDGHTTPATRAAGWYLILAFTFWLLSFLAGLYLIFYGGA